MLMKLKCLKQDTIPPIRSNGSEVIRTGFGIRPKRPLSWCCGNKCLVSQYWYCKEDEGRKGKFALASLHLHIQTKNFAAFCFITFNSIFSSIFSSDQYVRGLKVEWWKGKFWPKSLLPRMIYLSKRSHHSSTVTAWCVSEIPNRSHLIIVICTKWQLVWIVLWSINPVQYMIFNYSFFYHYNSF